MCCFILFFRIHEFLKLLITLEVETPDFKMTYSPRAMENVTISTEWVTQITNTTDQTEIHGVVYPIITINEYNIYFFVYSSVSIMLVTWIMPLIFSIGVVGNISVIIIFFRVRSMQTVTNHYLVNLAIADLAFLLFAVPQFWMQYATSPIINDFTHIHKIYCPFVMFFSDVTIIVSCTTVILLTLERYIAICLPHKFKQLSTRPRALMLCGMIWLVSASYKACELALVGVVKKQIIWPDDEKYANYPKFMNMCEYCDKTQHYCTIFRYSLLFDQFLILTVIPVTMVMYTLIVMQLQRLSKATTANRSSSSSTKMKTQVIRMLIVTITVYVICITPFRILNIFDIFGFAMPPDSIWALVNTARIMMYCNSAVNPVIYNIMSDRYRQAFRETFLCCLPAIQEMHNEVSTARKTKYTTPSMKYTEAAR